MKKIEVFVQLSYPTTNRPGGKTDAAGRYVSLRIKDDVSGQILVDLDLSAEEWTQILACEGIPIREGAATGEHLERIGKRMVHDQIPLGFNPSPEAAQAAVDKALADGWETAQVERRNFGSVVVTRKWVDQDSGDVS